MQIAPPGGATRRAALPAFLLASCLLRASPEPIPTYDFAPYLVVAPNVDPLQTWVYRDRIESSKPVDLAAILAAEMPVAALTRKGPLAGDIILRGFSRDNVLFTVDNNRTYCACPNRMDPPAFHVSSQQIESIRVRTGPFDVVEGNAIGGTVAVKTRPLETEPFADFYGYLGSFEYAAAGITAGAPLSDSLKGLGGIYVQQGGVYEDGSGTPFTRLEGSNYLDSLDDPTAFQVVTAEAKASQVIGETGALTINYAFQDASDVLYPGLRMDSPSDTMNRISAGFKEVVDAPAADRVEASIAYSKVDHDMTDAFRKSVNNAGGVFLPRGYFMRTEARSSYLGGKLVLEKDLSTPAFIRYGIDLNRRQWDADNQIGFLRNNMLPDTVTDTLGVWGVYEWRDQEWAFESGFRLDWGQSEAREDISFLQGIRQTSTNQRNDILPGFYGLLSRELGDAWTVYGGVGFASRSPDPQERYINLNRPMMNPDWVGNPDLDPVRNLEIQGGLEWATARYDARLNLFHSWVYDYIYLAGIESGAALATSYENIDARIYGLSGDLGWTPDTWLRLEAGFAWQEGVKDSLPPNASNDVLGEIPPLRMRLAAITRIDKLTAKAELQFQEDLDRFDPDLGEKPIEGWSVLNLSAGYQVTPSLSLSGGVDNVFDATYAVSNAFVRDPFRSGVIVNEPGRFWFIRAGLEF